MRPEPPPKDTFNLTSKQPHYFEEMAEPGLLLEINERLCYLTDLVEHALALEYLTRNPRR